MAGLVYKWLLLPFYLLSGSMLLAPAPYTVGEYKVIHPYYISVVELNHNKTDRTIEISCKIFTNDFETILEKNYKTKVDLVNSPDKAAADKMINDYVRKHLSLKVDNKQVSYSYVGFEKQDEAIYCYFQVDNIVSPKKIDVSNSLLHDFSDQQINIVHCVVDGMRQSMKLDYPKTDCVFNFE